MGIRRSSERTITVMMSIVSTERSTRLKMYFATRLTSLVGLSPSIRVRWGADAKVPLPCRVQAGGRGAPAGERRLPSPVFRGVAAARAVEQRPGRLSGWEDLSAYSAAAAASASSRSVSQVW